MKIKILVWGIVLMFLMTLNISVNNKAYGSSITYSQSIGITEKIGINNGLYKVESDYRFKYPKSNFKEINILKWRTIQSGENITDLLNKSLTLSKKQPIQLSLPQGTYYMNPIKVEESKGLYIKGHNTHLMFDVKNKTDYAFEIKLDKNNKGVYLEDFTLDGQLNNQDLFNEHFKLRRDSFDYNKISGEQKGFKIISPSYININNVDFKHMYGGFVLDTLNSKNIDINNVTIEDVGANNGFASSTGFIFNFGIRQPYNIINLNNVKAIGKTGIYEDSANSKLNLKSKIGIALHNDSIMTRERTTKKFDKYTQLNITNSEFNNYETFSHIENMFGKVDLNVKNSRVNAGSGIVVTNIFNKLNLNIEQSLFNIYSYGRNDAFVNSLIYAEENQFPQYNNGNIESYIKQSEFNFINDLNSDKYFKSENSGTIHRGTMSFVSHDFDIVNNYYNNKINNISKLLSLNSNEFYYNNDIDTKGNVQYKQKDRIKIEKYNHKYHSNIYLKYNKIK